MLWLDTDEPPSALPGTLLDVQRITGNSAAYKVITTGQRLTINANGIPDLALSYTPPVNAWWEVDLLLGLLNKTDAAYHYAQCILQCQPNDADGVSTYQSYIMRAAGCRWSFVYRAGGTAGGGLYKWEFIGGAPYQVSTDAVFSTAATAYAATAGPAFTLPFPGIYDIEIMGRVTTAAVAGNTAFLSYACGGTGANDNWSAIVSTPAAAVTTAGVTALARLTLTIAQLDLAAAMRSSAGSPGTVSSTFRRLRATPVALGYYA